MASDRQIAANRRNAQKSTGPKSKSGKKRSSMNAFRHGLSVPMSTVTSEAQFEKLMRQFAPGVPDETSLPLAERAAGAQLELARIRRVQNAMIEHALALLSSDAGVCGPDLDENNRDRITKNRRQATGPLELMWLDRLKPLSGGNEEKDQRLPHVVRVVLPELTKIIRYQKRAAGRRDRAIGEIMKSRMNARRDPAG